MKRSLSIESESQQARHSAVSANNVASIQAFADNRESTANLRQLKAAMANSPQAAAHREMKQLMNNSPRLLAQRKMLSGESVQRVEEEEPLQGKFTPLQRVEEEEPLQGRFETAQRVEEDESLQKKSEPIQRVEEEELQKKTATDSPAQLKEQSSVQTNNTANNTGLPGNLKSGIESLSGLSMDSVRVHYNSSQPAQLNALAYAQGTDIHVAPGQEQHLPHEAWHVVQQAQGRVQPTMQMKDGVPINDDRGLEHEADVMGERAGAGGRLKGEGKGREPISNMVAQRVKIGLVDINSKTPLKTIQDALMWSGLYGVQKELTAEERKELISELEDRDDCTAIVEDLRSEDSESSSEGEHDDREQQKDEEDDDLLGLMPQSSFLINLNSAFSSQNLAEEKRKKAAEAFAWKTFPESVDGLKKIGVHETSDSNVQGLMTDGPLANKFGSGNGLGKGEGFYVTHVGEKTLYSAIKGVKWGDNFLAVYVPQGMPGIPSGSEATNRVEILDEANIDTRCYYIMSGGSEIVIPRRSFPWVKLVTRPDQLAPQERQPDVIHDASLGGDQKRLIRAVYNEEMDFAQRMNELTVEYNHKSTTERRKKHLAQRWAQLQNVLFHRWGMNGQLYTLWLETLAIGIVVKEPGSPMFQ